MNISGLVVGALATVLLAGCSAPSAAPVAPDPSPSVSPAPAPSFPDDAVGDYQLGGAYAPAAGVTLVVRDSTDRPDPVRYNVCYVNGFQTQPGDGKRWLREHRDLVLHRRGKPVADPGWPDEYVLDVSTAAKRRKIAAVLDESLRRCADRGFQAVELDNLDSYTRSRKAFTLAANRAMAALYVQRGHALGLAVGQKNTPELGDTGRTTIGFDFAVAEECGHYDECAAYTHAYGGRVLSVEYGSKKAFVRSCARKGRPADMVQRDVDLRRPGTKGYVYRRCP